MGSDVFLCRNVDTDQSGSRLGYGGQQHPSRGPLSCSALASIHSPTNQPHAPPLFFLSCDHDNLAEISRGSAGYSDRDAGLGPSGMLTAVT